MTLTVGTTMGAYAIEREIGRGGMGIVYLARDTRLDRRVAIKALPEHLLQDAERLARFEREAKIVASLNHSGIAAIYALEQVDAKKYLVMEFVEGETLATRLERGRVPIDEALAIARQIAEALEAAHEKGIIHRDLKPGNVIVSPEGTVKVLDFGLAREAPKRPSGSRMTQVPTPPAMTEEGLAVGTPGYMSPEQARGREVDRRTDIFALGSVLFECLTGRPAFEGESAADTITATLEREPDWSLLPERTPPRVRDLLEECLAKDTKRRLRDIGDARLELERALERREWKTSGAMRAAPGARRSWRIAIPWAIAVIAVLGMGASAWRASHSASEPKRIGAGLPVRFTLHEPGIQQRPRYDTSSVAISVDGSMVAYKGFGAQGELLYVRRLSQSASTALVFALSPKASDPVFSHDGRWLAFACGLPFMKIPVDGGEPVTLLDSGQLNKGSSWSARGIVLTPGVSSGLALLPPDGGALTTLTMPDATRGEVSHRWPDALPGGRHVLFTVKKSDLTTFDDAEIALLDTETGRWRTIIKGGMFARFAPTGHIVYARAGVLLAVPFDERSGELRGAPIAMVQGVVTYPGSGAALFAIARDAGTLVYVPGMASETQFEMVFVDLDGKVTPVGAPVRNYAGMTLSPDGARLAAWVLGATDSVYVHDLARGISSRLTFQGNSSDTMWSRDGKRVGFISDRDGKPAVYVANADGTGATEQLADEVLGPNRSFVEIDGKEVILFERGRDAWIQPKDGPARALISSPVAMRWMRVSPDQRWMAYVSDESGQNEVYVRPFPTGEGKWQVSKGGGNTPCWLPGSDGVIYDEKGVLRRARRGPDGFDGTRIEELGTVPYGVFALNLVPDGSRFVGLRSLPVPPDSGRVEVVLNWFEELRAKAPAEAR